ncbi:hypothetical protein WR25_11944 [Diploscapter pachys]|uniref:Uncharacterized protein n=1 Tax=Diploscapter pachys TaxID=2018661 RepID=A0A2A2LK24_9BILA|nr:hypothetical protein WR25_11944 [Diploscapter pachys]
MTRGQPKSSTWETSFEEEMEKCVRDSQGKQKQAKNDRVKSSSTSTSNKTTNQTTTTSNSMSSAGRNDSSETSLKHSTMPDYSIEMDKYGRLHNVEKRLVWPSRVPLGAKEFTYYLKHPEKNHRKKKMINALQCRYENTPPTLPVKTRDLFESSLASSSTNTARSARYAICECEEAKDLFIGDKTEKQAASYVHSAASFVLYYRRPEANSLSLSMPLFVCYRSANSAVYHFPVVQSFRTIVKSFSSPEDTIEMPMWRFECGEERRIEFTTLCGLIDYYLTYSYFNPKSGDFEIFPISIRKKMKMNTQMIGR